VYKENWTQNYDPWTNSILCGTPWRTLYVESMAWRQNSLKL